MLREAPIAGSSLAEAAPEPKKAPLRITNIKDIRNYVQPTVAVYNPTDLTETVEMFGDWYSFKPKASRVLPHKMRYLTTIDKNPMSPFVKTLWEEELVVEVPSEEIATAICSDDVRGQKGFTVLIGDGQDDERMAMADERWVQWRLSDARAREAGYVAICMEVAKIPGSKPPRMRLDVKQALLWLEQYESGEFRVAAAAAKDIAEENALLLRRNPALKEQLESVPPSATARAEEEELLASTRTVASPPPAGSKEIIAKARELGVKLKLQELEGLAEGDAIVQSAVIKRLAKVAADKMGRASAKRK